MNKFVKFFHELRNPHCSHCIDLMHEERDNEREKKHCESCDTLNSQLVQANNHIEMLMKRLLEKPEPVIQMNTEDLKPIQTTKSLPWRVRQQALETEDRHTAKLMRDKQIEMETKPVDTGKSTIEELEVIVGVKENA